MTHKPHCALALGKGNSGPYEVKKNSFDLEFPPQPDRVLGIGMLFNLLELLGVGGLGRKRDHMDPHHLFVFCILYSIFSPV